MNTNTSSTYQSSTVLFISHYAVMCYTVFANLPTSTWSHGHISWVDLQWHFILSFMVNGIFVFTVLMFAGDSQSHTQLTDRVLK
jgi:hypothetical protein